MSNHNLIPEKISKFEKIILFLSIYVILELYIHSILIYPEIVITITEIIDFIICLIFLFDFFIRWKQSKEKLKFLNSNWIDFLSSIPMIGVLRIGRAVRIIRVLRIARSGRIFYKFINKNNSLSTFKSIVILNIILLTFASISIYQLEHNINPYFNNLKDSFWWCIITTTTLGFVKDITPLSPEGKLLSVILIGLGILLFGTFTAMVADFFIGDEEIRTEIKDVKKKLNQIEEKINILLKK